MYTCYIDGTVADSWTVTNSDAFDVFDVTTNIGELTISDAPESTGDDGLTLSRTVSGDIEMIAQLNLLTFGDISGDSGTCLSGEDPDEETEICTGDPLDVNETPNVAFGTAHHYETGNFLDSLRIIVTDGIDMAVFLIGKQYDDGDNTIYCLATDTDEQEEFDDTNCNVTVSEEAPFYIKLEKEDATGTVTYSIKSGSDGSYIEVGSITQSGFASTDVTVMFGFYDEDELDCYSDLCRAAWGADTNPGYIPSLEVRFESIVFSSGTTTGLY